MKRILVFFTLGFLLIIVYQNCGQVTLQKMTQAEKRMLASSGHSYKAHFCLGATNGVQYSLMRAVVLNLNAVQNTQNTDQFLSDSDMDGVVDTEDENPINSHSHGYIDQICYLSGSCAATPSCLDGGQYYQPGITRCDLSTYTILGGTYNKFDSNFNGVPDFIEIIRKMSPIAYNDPMQTHLPIVGQPRVIENDTSCPSPNTKYEIELPQSLPFVETDSYTDTRSYLVPGTGANLNLSHLENENIIYTAIILRSKTFPTQYLGYLHLDKIQDSHYPSVGSYAQQDIFIGNGDATNSEYIFIGMWGQ